MAEADFLDLLEDLTGDQFEKFKWFLDKEKLGDIKPIKNSQLEKAERRDVVNLMVQKYEPAGAVEVMKSVLKKINRNDLVKKLPNISSGSEAAVALKEQTRSTHSTTETFWKEKQDDDRVYKVTKKSITSRVALLITNIEFENKKYNRSGADRDEQNMEQLLTALNYEVVKYTNLTGKGIEEAVKKFSKHPKLEHTDSVFVVIMSHGEQTAVHGVNVNGYKRDKEQETFPIEDIFTHLNTLNCPKLRDKPKIIIIQACSGGKNGGVTCSDQATAAVESDNIQELHPSQCDGEEVIEADRLGLAHREESFICFRSSTPDTVSYRRSDTGSFFIQYIVEVLNTFAHEDHIEELFGRVMQRFKGLKVWTKERGDDTQMPTKHRVSLYKKFYLFPGL